MQQVSVLMVKTITRKNHI